MGSVRRNASGLTRYIAGSGLAAVLGIASTGCAGLGSSRGSDSSFLGGFWDFGKPYEPMSGGDAYAQQLNEARARAAARQASADQHVASQEKLDPKKGDDGQAKPAKPGDPAKPDDPAKSDDAKPKLSASRARADRNTIRVTLGRPESLPVIAGIPRDSSSTGAMASATPKWKKESSENDRVAIERDLEPAAPPAEIAHAEISRARVEPREIPDLVKEAEATPAVVEKTNEEKIEEILDRAKARLKSLSAYQVAMSRVERVGGQLQNQENVILSVRRAPKAVRLQWEDGPNKGREVIYSTSLDERVIHVNMANSAIPLPRMAIAVDSPMIMRNSRHSIKEAGFDTILNHMSEGPSRDDAKGSSGGKVLYKGVVKPEGLDRPCHRFVRMAPNGERWEVLLDTISLLPRSVVAHDARGELLERYTYRDLKENPIELSSADAFDPDSRWGKSKGLFSRLAGAAASVGGGGATPSTTR